MQLSSCYLAEVKHEEEISRSMLGFFGFTKENNFSLEKKVKFL